MFCDLIGQILNMIIMIQKLNILLILLKLYECTKCIYVTLGHKTSHKGIFFNRDVYIISFLLMYGLLGQY